MPNWDLMIGVKPIKCFDAGHVSECVSLCVDMCLSGISFCLCKQNGVYVYCAKQVLIF